MRRTLAFLAMISSSLSLVAGDIPMPPTMPNIALKKDVSKDVNKSAKTKMSDDTCKIIPPMLVHLPPMLENDLDRCKNSLHMPSVSVAQKRLRNILKKDLKVSRVFAIKGFSMLYKIESNVGDFYCNRYVDRCLTSSMRVIE